MTRFVSSDNATEAAKASIVVVVLADIDFASGVIRVHDGAGSLSFGGNTYSGIGQFGGVDIIDESVDIVARGIKLTLSGVDSVFITPAMTEIYQNRPVTLYLGFINQATGVFVDTPETIWEGRMNQMTFNIDKGSAVIELTCEHRLRREPRVARYTNQDQQVVHPNDRFFDLIHTIQGFVGKWGARDTNYGGGGIYTDPNTRPTQQQ